MLFVVYIYGKVLMVRRSTEAEGDKQRTSENTTRTFTIKLPVCYALCGANQFHIYIMYLLCLNARLALAFGII